MKSRRRSLLSLSCVSLSLLCSHATLAAPAVPPSTAPAQATQTAPFLRLPKGATPTRYALDLTLRPSDDKFSGQIEIALQIDEAKDVIWLHGSRELTIGDTVLKTAQGDLSPKVDLVSKDLIALRFAKPLSVGSASLKIRYQGKLPLAEGSGLFRERDGQDFYIYSHFEPLDARRAFPGFDEPGFKVPWQVTMHIPKEHTALSNYPVESEQEEAGGMKRVQFRQTLPLPSYLMAFAVGPFGVVDAGKAGKKGTPIRIVTLRGHEQEAAYAAKTSGQLLSLLEDYFGIPYPYEKLDQIAVPGQRGAMEHPGLITYGQGLIQIRPTEETVRSRHAFASVAAHELGHQWSGNLVTLAYWDDLWLNESLATYLESKIVGRFQPEWREVQNRVQRRQGAMFADSLITARKIRQPIESSDDVVNAFDGITYAKGGSVLEMFESWIGEKQFAAGLSRYMREHSHKNGTAADLIGAWTKELSDAAAQSKVPAEAEDLRQKSAQLPAAIASFLDQPGLPLISVSLACSGGSAKLSLAQTRYLPMGTASEAKEVYKVPVCLRYRDGSKGAEQKMCKLLDEKQAEWTLQSASCPEYVVANADALGYYRVQYSAPLAKAIKDRGFGNSKQSILSEMERISFLGDQSALMRIGKAAAEDVLQLATLAAKDESRHVLGTAAAVFAGVELFVPDALRPQYQKRIISTFGARQKQMGLVAKPQEDDNTKMMRGVLARLVGGEGAEKSVVADATQLAKKWLANRSSVDAETIRLALGIAAEHGDSALFDTLYQAAKAEPDRNQRALLLNALGGFRNPQLAQRGLDLVLKGDFSLNESMVLLWGPMGNPSTRRLPYEFVKAHFDELVAKLPKDSGARLAGMAGALCSDTDRAEAETFFSGRSTKYVGGPRILRQTLERISQCAALKAAQTDSVANFLKKGS